MQHKEWPLTSTWRYLIIITLLLGLFFRCFNIDRKVYWHDEVFTSLRISGYTVKDIKQQIFNGTILNREDLLKFHHPNLEKGLNESLNALAIDDPQHPPLYYIILRFWVYLFGGSVTAVRSLSVVISLLAFPGIYWLCWELFEIPLIGWIASIIIAISPFHILYAQEAREYVLWTVTTLLSSAALLQAIRLNTKSSWGIYILTVLTGLYTFMFTVLVAIGHGIYVILLENLRWTKTLASFLISSLIIILGFLPWLLVFFNNYQQFSEGTNWTSLPVGFSFLLQMWAFNLISIFIDFGVDLEDKWLFVISYIFLILVGYAIYLLCRQTPKRIWLFIVTLILTTALALILPDLILGGQRSTVTRYLIPSLLGIELALAYLLAFNITNISLAKRKFWQTITFLLVGIGIVSCSIISQSEISWIKPVSYNIPAIAQIIKKSPQPLVISDSFLYNLGNIISLSYELENQTKFILVVPPNIPTIPNIPNTFSDIFLINPIENFKKLIEEKNQIKTELIFNDPYISVFQVKK